jgi:hypothetical protein
MAVVCDGTTEAGGPVPGVGGPPVGVARGLGVVVLVGLGPKALEAPRPARS